MSSILALDKHGDSRFVRYYRRIGGRTRHTSASLVDAMYSINEASPLFFLLTRAHVVPVCKANPGGTEALHVRDTGRSEGLGPT